MSDLLNLEITISAHEWGYVKRRQTYLEALLLRIVRDEAKVREWFAAGELAEMGLPSLPASAGGIRTRAAHEKWLRRKTRQAGHWLYVYHVTSLPARAFDALIARLVNLPPIDELVPMPEIMPPPPDRATGDKAGDISAMAPPWVLPLMRIIKSETHGDLGAAWEILPDRLPPSVELPTVEEAAHILVALGLVREVQG